MERRYLYYILIATFIQGIVHAQEGDVTETPLEIGIQSIVDGKEADDGAIEGSGDPYIEESVDANKEVVPTVEHITAIDDNANEQEETNSSTVPCPKPCVCIVEGDSNELSVDCSGYSLTELPSPIDTKTSKLNLNNNKLTEIPKEISALKNLKILNANDNSIMDLAAGSVSELPALVSLNLANNRLIDFPQELKNSLSLTKLEEINLGGNNMRTDITPSLFAPLKSLRKLTLPKVPENIAEKLCSSFKETLEAVCFESCKSQSFDCPEAPENIGEDLFDATLPGLIAFDASDIKTLTENDNKETNATSSTPTESTIKPTTTTVEKETVPPATESSSTTTEFSLRNAVNKEPTDNIALNSIVYAPTEITQVDSEVKIGAKTADVKTGGGGVDKSIVGIVIAVMIVIVAVIAIKKNWSSITKKFSSTPRPNERGNANGTVPEEVPLQDKTDDKSPV